VLDGVCRRRCTAGPPQVHFLCLSRHSIEEVEKGLDAAVTAFFIPGLDPRDASTEDVYADICAAAHLETSHRPAQRRIFTLSFRGEGADLEAEVGKPYPIGGETVLAILDLGRHCPYLIHCGSPGGSLRQIIVPKPVYADTEFSR
jgi:hypothetical protein